MLVLTRRAGESIVIGDDVRVVVLDVRGDTVRLGIEAPRSIQVHRAEVYAEVQAANSAAAGGDFDAAAERLRRLARPAARTSARSSGSAGTAAAAGPAARPDARPAAPRPPAPRSAPPAAAEPAAVPHRPITAKPGPPPSRSSPEDSSGA